jgi:hypothetical protein
MVDHTRVNIQHLSDFGQKTAGFGISGGGDDTTLSRFTNAAGKPDGEIGKGSFAGQFLRTNEAKIFNDYYTNAVLGPLQSFMQDSPKGFMALGGGAVVMAANYNNGDQDQAEGMDNVYKMFTADPSKGLDADLTKQQNAKAKDDTTVKVELPPPTNDDKAVSPNDQTTSPDRQANDLYNKYHDDMTWPNKGDAPDPHTKILAPGPPPGLYPDSQSNSSSTGMV